MPLGLEKAYRVHVKEINGFGRRDFESSRAFITLFSKEKKKYIYTQIV
jgi:hypothetical protein